MTLNPNMLRLARVSRDMTQGELAAAAGVTQPAISHAENGIVDPTPDHISKIARALRYEPDIFGRPDPLLPLTPLFRKRAALLKKKEAQISALVRIRACQVDRIVSSFELEDGVPRIDLDDAIGKTCPAPRTATEAAIEVRRRWRVPPGPIKNLARLVEAHGVAVLRMRGVGDNFSGVSVVDHTSAASVLITTAEAPGCRDRWTLAHELGHIVLHHHLLHIPEDAEKEADEFASEFLMPAEQIRDSFYRRRITLDTLADLKPFWRVSMQSLLLAAKRIGAASDAQVKQIYKRMSMLGYRKDEPVRVAADTASMIDEMIRVHLEDLGYTEDELAQALWIDVEELRRDFLNAPSRTLASVPAPAGRGIQREGSPSEPLPRPHLRVV